MIEFARGDVIRADAQALVNTVNCVGVMGRGVALQFKKAFPENFDAYKVACDRHRVHPGQMLVFERHTLDQPRFIINFPTKRHWKGKSRIEDITAGLAALVNDVRRLRIESIALPPLGCGLGGLKWTEVRPLIQEAFAALPDVHVLVYEPSGAPSSDTIVKAQRAPKMTAGRAALVALMDRYLRAVMDPCVTLLEIHKLMYFMQEAGEGLRLRYAKGIYGPYADNLRHVLSQIDGHLISGYGDAEDKPDKQIELMTDAVDVASAFLSGRADTIGRLDRVAELIHGFETSFGLELLATVHWVAKREAATTPDEALAKVYAWNDRKRMFQKAHVTLAWNVMAQKGWLA
jgi:O-acetyl-ADP-ribose deacetylase (regulator of RNase III)